MELKITSSRRITREITKKNFKKKTVTGYLLGITSGDEVFVTDIESYTYGLYDIPEEGRDCAVFEEILMKRMFSAVSDYVCFKKRTLKQATERALRADTGEENFLERYRENALNRLAAYLTENGYIDDMAAGRSVVRNGIAGKMSPRMIRMKLEEAGIPADKADILLEEADINEEDAAMALAMKKVGAEPGARSLSEKERASLYRFLSGKGYSSGAVSAVLSKYTREGGDDEF